MHIVYLHLHDPAVPLELKKHLTSQTLDRISILGNLDIVKVKKTAFFCSTQCPGHILTRTQELAKKGHDEGVTVISGFHSPAERECLKILLRCRHPVIVCPARSIETMRVKNEFRTPLAEGRLLFLSPFSAKEKRMTARTAVKRNRFVAGMADEVFVAHAAGGGKIEVLCRELAAGDKRLMTFVDDSNANLLALGVKPF